METKVAYPGHYEVKTVNMSYARFFSSETEYLTFYSKSSNAKARLLSNFSTHTVCIDFSSLVGQSVGTATYPSGEHAFHGGKFVIISSQSGVSSSRRAELLAHSRLFEGVTLKDSRFTSAAAAKEAGGRSGIRLTATEMQNWDVQSMLLQEQICREKLKDLEIQQFLQSTCERYLVHFERSRGWPRYGAMVHPAESSPCNDGMQWMKGDNLLGEMWMTIREELLRDTTVV